MTLQGGIAAITPCATFSSLPCHSCFCHNDCLAAVRGICVCGCLQKPKALNCGVGNFMLARIQRISANSFYQQIQWSFDSLTYYGERAPHNRLSCRTTIVSVGKNYLR